MDDIYRLKNGQYVSDVSFEESSNIVERIACEGMTIPLCDYGHCNHCLIARKDGELGMMFLWSCYPTTYGLDACPFKCDKLLVFTGFCDEYAYVIAHEGKKCSVLKVTDGSLDNITVIEDDCKDSYPIWLIPADYRESPFQLTPTRISKLEPNEIFVFGSNKEGCHGGGAATFATDRFGARRALA